MISQDGVFPNVDDRIQTQQYNFATNWDAVIKPHLEKMALNSALKKGMLEYVDSRNRWYRQYRVAKRIGWSLEDGPASLSLYDKKDQTEPGTLSWYQPFGLCHWISPFVLTLVRHTHRNRRWIKVSGRYHSIVTDPERKLVFDILNFHKYTARFSLVYAGDSPINEKESSFLNLVREKGDVFFLWERAHFSGKFSLAEELMREVDALERKITNLVSAT